MTERAHRQLVQGEGHRRVLMRVRWSLLCFVVLSILFSAGYTAMTASPGMVLRAGILADLVAELPQGRQALVSSLQVLPLPTLLALPFAMAAHGRALGLACLYAVALAAALAVPALAALMGTCRVSSASGEGVSSGEGRRAAVAALAMIVGGASAMRLGQGDAFIAAAMLVIALALEFQTGRVVRSLTGTFYGLAMLSHPVGLAAALVRLAGFAWVRVVKRDAIERIAVNWVRACQVITVMLTYVFLSWVIMGEALYAVKRPAWGPMAALDEAATEELAEVISTDFENCVPVTSGLWGYLGRGPLERQAGYRFLDFHPDKLPTWEDRDVLLVIPMAGNPASRLSDMAPDPETSPLLREALLLKQTEDWVFYLLKRI